METGTGTFWVGHSREIPGLGTDRFGFVGEGEVGTKPGTILRRERTCGFVAGVGGPARGGAGC